MIWAGGIRSERRYRKRTSCRTGIEGLDIHTIFLTVKLCLDFFQVIPDKTRGGTYDNISVYVQPGCHS